ncbi:MAG TPA: hypothetical protein VFY89_04715 [Ktedonobacterales bacterium]
MERRETRRKTMARETAPDALARLERRLEQRWRDLAMAEQRGQPTQVLERMYAAYLRELEAYLRAQRDLAGHQTQSRLAS